MRLLITCSTLIASIFLTITAYAYPSEYTNIKLEPEQPVRGQFIKVTYYPTDKVFVDATTITALYYNVDSNREIKVLEFPMKQSGNSWSVKMRIPENSAAFLLGFTDGKIKDMNDNAGYNYLVYGTNGKVLQESYKVSAELFGSIIPNVLDEIKVKKSQKSVEYYKKYYESINFDSLHFLEKLRYLYNIRDKDRYELYVTFTPAYIINPIQDYKYVADMSARLGEFISNRIFQTLHNVNVKEYIKKFPHSYEAFKDKIDSCKNAGEKENLLAQLVKNFPPETPEEKWRIMLILRATISLYIKENNVSKALDLTKQLPYSQAKYSFTKLANTLAASGSTALATQALPLYMQLFEELDEEMKVQKNKPSFYTSNEYASEIEANKILNYQIYALLLFNTNRYEEALDYQKQFIAQPIETSVGSLRFYTAILEKLNDSSLITELERFIKNGSYDEQMEAQLKRLFLGKNNASDYSAYFEGLKSEKANTLESAMIHEKAPDFELFDENGNKVSLASLKGKTIVLDFWSMGCKACIASFPMMYRLQEKKKAAGENVVFLFANTWEFVVKQQQVIDFIKSKPFNKLNVVFDKNNKAAGDFKIKSLPSTFIISPDGFIKFKFGGFNAANEKETLAEIEAMIGLASGAQ